MAEFLVGAAAFILSMVALGLIRILRGPGNADRIMAAQLLGTGGIAAMLAAAAPSVAGTVDGLRYDLDWTAPEGPDRAGCVAGIDGLEALERRRRDPTAPVVERALLAGRIAGESAKMRLPEILHGVVPDPGGTARLFQMAR
jgi:hypothetical protein